MTKRLTILMIVAIGLLSACNEAAEPTATPAALPAEPTAAGPDMAPAEEQPTQPTALPPAEAATAYPVPEAATSQAPDVSGYPAPDMAAGQAPPATGYPAPGTAATPSGPMVLPYITQPQQEGPYYPVEKPAERDNNLTLVAGAAGPPQGEVLEFGGRLLDVNGVPVRGPAIIEIWQADANGIYLHPDDPDTDQRDMNFQFYGEAMIDSEGRYSFWTILPGEYEPRPRHIHFKVVLNNEVLLISQFYPEGGPVPASGQDASLILTLSEGQDAAGNRIYTAERDIILSRDLSSR